MRSAAIDLFGLTNETFGKSLAYRQQAAAARFTPAPSVSTFRQRPQYTHRIVDAVAGHVIDMLSAVTLGELQQRTNAELIDRPDLVKQAVAELSATGGLVWIWGEPGTGKTALAGQIPARMTLHLPVVRVRMNNTRVMQQDLIRAIGQVGIDATEWTDGACTSYFRTLVAQGDAFGLVIIDDVSGPTEFAELELGPIRVPVIVTSRLANPEVAGSTLRVEGFSAAETDSAITVLLPALAQSERSRLANIARGRPLIIDRICRYLRSCDSAQIPGVLEALAQDTGRVLNAIESINATDRDLVTLYEHLISSLGQLGDTVAVLDSLVWIAADGLVDRALANAFLAHRFPGAVGSVVISSAIAILAQRGIVTVEDEALSIHGLTVDILQHLRRGSMNSVVSDFVDFLRTPPAEPTKKLQYLLHSELTMAERLDPDGQEWLLCLDELTWLRIQAEDAREERLVRRYRLGKEEGGDITVRTDAADVRVLAEDESDELQKITSNYYELGLILYRSTLEPEPETTPSDGYLHTTRGWVISPDGTELAQLCVCGKRLRSTTPAAEWKDLPRCPSCTDRHWPRILEAALKMRPRTYRGDAVHAIRTALEARDPEAALHHYAELRANIELTRPSIDEDLLTDLARTERSIAELLRDQQSPNALDMYRRSAANYALAMLLTPDSNQVLDASWSVLLAQVELVTDDGPEVAGALYADAAAQYRRVVDQRNDVPSAMVYLGRCLAAQSKLAASTESAIGLYEEAAGLLREAVSDRPDHSDLRATLGMVLSNHGDLLRQHDPGASAKLYLEANAAYLQMARLKPADHNGWDLVWYSFLSVLDLNQLDQPELVTLIEHATQFLRQAANHQPQRADLPHRLGLALMYAGDALSSDHPDDAISAYTESAAACRAGIESGDDAAAVRADLVMALGKHADLVKGRDRDQALHLLAEAVQQARTVVEQDERHMFGFHNLGALEYRRADLLRDTDVRAAVSLYREAIAHLRRYTEATPNDVLPLRAVSDKLAACGDLVRSGDQQYAEEIYREAEQHIELCLRCSPGDADATRTLAALLERRADLPVNADGEDAELRGRAVENFRAYVEARPDDMSGLRSLAYNLRRQAGHPAAAEQADAIYASAEACYRRLVNSAALTPADLYHLGYLLRRRASALADRDHKGAITVYAEAVDHLERLVSLPDDYPGGRGSLAFTLHLYGTLLRASDPAAAADLHRRSEQAYLQSLAIDPDNPGTHYNLACISALRADIPGAVGYLRTWWQASSSAGTHRYQTISEDPDFDRVRTAPLFTAALRELAEQRTD